MNSYIKLRTEQEEVNLYNPEITLTADGVSVNGVSSDLLTGKTWTVKGVPLNIWSQKCSDYDSEGLFREVTLKTSDKGAFLPLAESLVCLRAQAQLLKVVSKPVQNTVDNLGDLFVKMSCHNKWTFNEADCCNIFANELFSVIIYPDHGTFSCPTHNYNVTWEKSVERSSHPNRNIRPSELRNMLQECLETLNIPADAPDILRFKEDSAS